VLNFDERRVFVFSVEIDMRKGPDSLAYLIREQMQRNVMEGDAYLFLGKNRRRIKVIVFDGTGLVLIAKRLEKGRFQEHWELAGRDEITREELRLIFAGTRINFPYEKKDFVMAAPALRAAM
jgi:transposase